MDRSSDPGAAIPSTACTTLANTSLFRSPPAAPGPPRPHHRLRLRGRGRRAIHRDSARPELEPDGERGTRRHREGCGPPGRGLPARPFTSTNRKRPTPRDPVSGNRPQCLRRPPVSGGQRGHGPPLARRETRESVATGSMLLLTGTGHELAPPGHSGRTCYGRLGSGILLTPTPPRPVTGLLVWRSCRHLPHGGVSNTCARARQLLVSCRILRPRDSAAHVEADRAPPPPARPFPPPRRVGHSDIGSRRGALRD